jgi:hypothetical protein
MDLLRARTWLAPEQRGASGLAPVVYRGPKLRYFLDAFDPIAAGGYVGQCWDGEQWTGDNPERSCEWWERDDATAFSLFARFVEPHRSVKRP